MDRPSSPSTTAERRRVRADDRETCTDARVDKNHYRKDDAVTRKRAVSTTLGILRRRSPRLHYSIVYLQLFQWTLHADVMSSQSPRGEKSIGLLTVT